MMVLNAGSIMALHASGRGPAPPPVDAFLSCSSAPQSPVEVEGDLTAADIIGHFSLAVVLLHRDAALF